MTPPTESELIESAIRLVWNEKDDARRLARMADLYYPDATIYEPDRTVTGHSEISAVVAGVLKDMPPGFAFRVIGPTLGHHGVAITQWEGGPGTEVTVSGSDVIVVRDGLIVQHFFYFHPGPD